MGNTIVKSTTKRCDEIWNYAPFVCGKTWLSLKKWASRSHSMHSLQAENGLSTVRYNFRVCMMLLPQTMSSMFCKHSCRLTLAYVFPSPLPIHLFAEDNHFCIVLSQKFNIVSAIPVQQLAIARKKSILAKVFVWTQMGLVLGCWRMNIYYNKLSIAPYFEPFLAKCGAICC